MHALALTMDDFATQVAPTVTIPRTDGLVAAAYDRHRREMFTFALRASRDPGAAEDLVQEAFTRLIQEVEADRTPRNVRAWLYRVVANLVVSRARRTNVAQRELGTLAIDDEDHGPEPTYLDHERQSDIDLVLGKLEPDARTALLMAASGFNGMEIAEAIGRSGNATRTLMCRTRLEVRHRLEAMAGWA
jgi:RNA polymerase sigma-70 factor (ECF subfamily)